MTILPIVETHWGDVSVYIPTNLVSMIDGQILLSANLFNARIKPAINVEIFVSRLFQELVPDLKTNDIVSVCIAKGRNQETRDDAISQAMLRVLERVFKIMVKKNKILEGSKWLECERKEKNEVRNKRKSSYTDPNSRQLKGARNDKPQQNVVEANIEVRNMLKKWVAEHCVTSTMSYCLNVSFGLEIESETIYATMHREYRDASDINECTFTIHSNCTLH
ncbi:hypothetical protein Goshw_020085 [Gossypium schwendimanii]|uniref:ATPase F1/V1/A1 complex alpha/beta subunit nucleotide-binding domain-containing protein n=1 Tax=Gossypium schwendimanii TaxID=34291 RepID=A0A7J9KY70_GOSSC|nr:hypothetical protein [Gossypium schwendimanii]